MTIADATSQLRACSLYVTVEEGLIKGNHRLNDGRRFTLKRWEDGRWCATLHGLSDQNVGPGALASVVAVMVSWYGGTR